MHSSGEGAVQTAAPANDAPGRPSSIRASGSAVTGTTSPVASFTIG